MKTTKIRSTLWGFALAGMVAAFSLNGCKKEEMPPAETKDCHDTVRVTITMVKPPDTTGTTKVSPVIPVDINKKGFELIEKMQGHWIGTNKVMAWDWDWFALDYRAVSNSHVFGIFEGGNMGNLFTSFFVTDFKNTRTIMARNGECSVGFTARATLCSIV
ncbi:hypothetical protein KFE98_17435 [bacterium SCSIO 12741]|nr:hypothetical protein KFE98_17435 [bacterium SCSIO 12741]